MVHLPGLIWSVHLWKNETSGVCFAWRRNHQFVCIKLLCRCAFNTFLKSWSMQCENFMYVIDVTKDWFLHLRFNHNCKSITNAKSPPAEGVFLNVYFKKVEDLLLHSLALAFWTCWPTSNTLDKNTEMSSTFRTLKFVENGQQTAGLLLATLSERLINLFLDTKESVCTTCEEKQIWLVSLTELSFEVNFPDIEDLQLRMLKRKWWGLMKGGRRQCRRH